MNPLRTTKWLLALCAMAAAPTFAQTAAMTNTGPEGAPTVQHGASGIDYLNGGGGSEDRSAMAARSREFPFKVVLSDGTGEYIVAEKLSLVTPKGEMLAVKDAGPIVMAKLPPGPYTLEVTYKGKTERRAVRVQSGAQTVNLRLPS